MASWNEWVGNALCKLSGGRKTLRHNYFPISYFYTGQKPSDEQLYQAFTLMVLDWYGPGTAILDDHNNVIAKTDDFGRLEKFI